MENLIENLIGKCYKYSNKYCRIVDKNNGICVTPNYIEHIGCKYLPLDKLIEISLDEFEKVLNERLEFFRILEPKKEKYFTPEQIKKIMLTYQLRGEWEFTS